MASEMAQSGAGQGVLPISLSFRAARIVAARRIAYLRSFIESSSGNGCSNHAFAKDQIDHVAILGRREKRKRNQDNIQSQTAFSRKA